VLVYAPTKAHVVVPPAADRLPPEKVHAFVSLRRPDPLPPPREFLETLPAKMESYETAVRTWCQAEGVPFLSLTAPLREAAAAGRQVYYTYDQHWTATGHQVVADAVARFRQNRVGPAGA